MGVRIPLLVTLCNSLTMAGLVLECADRVLTSDYPAVANPLATLITDHPLLWGPALVSVVAAVLAFGAVRGRYVLKVATAACLFLAWSQLYFDGVALLENYRRAALLASITAPCCSAPATPASRPLSSFPGTLRALEDSER